MEYVLTIETPQIISVEDLLSQIAERYTDGFHELIADDLHAEFGGRQILKAYHHGVEIKTVRGALAQKALP